MAIHYFVTIGGTKFLCDESCKDTIKTPCATDKPEVSLVMKSTDILPDNVPPGTSAWISDKLGVVFYDGEGNWYRKQDTPFPAGQPASVLF